MIKQECVGGEGTWVNETECLNMVKTNLWGSVEHNLDKGSRHDDVCRLWRGSQEEIPWAKGWYCFQCMKGSCLVGEWLHHNLFGSDGGRRGKCASGSRSCTAVQMCDTIGGRVKGTCSLQVSGEIFVKGCGTCKDDRITYWVDAHSIRKHNNNKTRIQTHERLVGDSRKQWILFAGLDEGVHKQKKWGCIKWRVWFITQPETFH